MTAILLIVLINTVSAGVCTALAALAKRDVAMIVFGALFLGPLMIAALALTTPAQHDASTS
jgi:predicted transporter